MSEQRSMEIEVALDATPAQVWEAIATGPGISAWFVPTAVEADRIRQDFGSGFVVDGQVTASEPGSRFAYGALAPDADSPETPGGPNYAFEFMVEGRAGGSTVLRFVQSGFVESDGWEAEYDSFRHGWTMFFANLAAYLEHFADRPVHNVVTMGFTALPRDEAWSVFHDALGLAKAPEIGDEVRLTPDGLPAISGVVDLASREFLGVRTAGAPYRFGAEGTDGCGISAYHYYFDAAELVEPAAWQAWLSGLFPVPLFPVPQEAVPQEAAPAQQEVGAGPAS